MRILWLSNKVLSEQDRGATGTWLDALACGLADSGQIDLANISQSGVSEVVRRDIGLIQQWVLPAASKLDRRSGLPPASTVVAIVDAVDEFAADLVHVWGTENYWGLLTARKYIKQPALLETQGLKGAIAQVFEGGLSLREQLGCIGPKEIARASTISRSRKQFEAWGDIEREIIRGHRFITTQSDWLRAQIVSINRLSTVFHNEFALRKPFYAASPWQPSETFTVFCSAAYPYPFKGVHVALRAVALLRERFPMIQLRIAGAYQKQGLRQDGYVLWLNRETKRLGIEKHVCWLGSISAAEIICELYQCAAMVLPSFVEGYSLALAEAMLLGVPSVASFAGGITSIAQHEETALFFPPGDAVMCAYQLERLLTDRTLAARMGRQARAVALVRNDRKRVVENQIRIYHQVLEETAGQPG